jgi:sialidase-1
MMRALSLGVAIFGFGAAVAGVAAEGELWTHPLSKPLVTQQYGPFLGLPDGSLMTIEPQGMRTSRDEGATWSDPVPVTSGIPGASSEHALVRTTNGVLVMLYLDMGKDVWRFTWDSATGEPKEDCKLEIWGIRSLDGGKTWVDKQLVLEGYNAEFFGFIQTRGGRLVASVEHLVTKPGHWVTLSLYSEDEGKTWKRSNLIDLGGRGHHDGSLEPSMAELSDGRLLMLIRTNFDRFWQAFSEDGGRYWRALGPTQVAASTSPGKLLRLASGRLALLYNQVRAEGTGQGQPRFRPLSALGSQVSEAMEVPSSWYRAELSLAFSEDDGRTWTAPVVVARLAGGSICYPYLFERLPGELWISVDNADKKGWANPVPLRIKVNENEMVKACAEAAPAKVALKHVDVFASGTDGYNCFRIPVVETAPDGSILAFAEARKYNCGDPGDPNNEIDLVLKRSTDGGATWSAMTVVEHSGEKWSSANPSTLVDRSNGRIWMLYARCKPARGTDGARAKTDDLQTLARTSDDNGVTWSEPIDLTAVARDMNDDTWTSSVVGPGGGIQMRSGRLVIPVWTYPGWSIFVLFSDDHGKTWQRGAMVPRSPGGNECEVVELADGKLLIDVRQNGGLQRWFARSTDGGQTWSEPFPGNAVSPVACAIERYSLTAAGDDLNRILWTGPRGPGRNNLVLRISYDEGLTFATERVIAEQPAAYSDLTILKDKAAGVLWERANYQFITFTRLDRDFIEPNP